MSRIQRGFHRLGLLLCAPVLLLALFFALQQLGDPTGALRPVMPKGTLGYKPANLDEVDGAVIKREQSNGIIAPDGLIVLGIEVRRPANRFHRFIDDGVETSDYQIFQLPDGREIVLGTSSSDRITNATYHILRYEAGTGLAFPFDSKELAGDVPVSLAYADKREPQNPWPFAATQRSPDFQIAGLFAAMSVAIYTLLAGVGWVVRGFASK